METLENNINITFVEISENLKNKKEFIDYSKLKKFTIVICDLSIDNEQELVMTQLKKVNLNKEVCFLLFDKKGYCINNNVNILNVNSIDLNIKNPVNFNINESIYSQVLNKICDIYEKYNILCHEVSRINIIFIGGIREELYNEKFKNIVSQENMLVSKVYMSVVEDDDIRYALNLGFEEIYSI